MFVLFLLAAVYALGFIITPYWTRAQSKAGVIFILALTIGVGAIWSFLSAGSLQIRLGPIRWRYFLILLAGVVILNIRPLTTSIPWRGDEDYFILITLALASKLSTSLVVASLVAFVLLAYLAWKKSKLTIILGIMSIAGEIILITITNPLKGISSTYLLRYPFISYWFFTIIPGLALLLKINPYQEIFFRMVPFISTFVLIWIFQKQLTGSETVSNLTWGIAAATIPLVYYYSSILYMELPAVVLMLVVCLNIKNLLYEDFQQLKQNPAWYALILIGFIKETTVPFLVCFLGWRILASLLRKRVSPLPLKRRLRILLDEAGIVLAVLLPILFYLFLRSTLSQQERVYSFTISNLLNIVVYRTIVRAFLEQFGVPLLLLFGGGCLLLILEKEYLHAGFILSLCILYPLFHASDILIYTGYSRFNLFVVPAILAGASILIKRIIKYRNILGVVAACVVLVVNVWISPVFIDGTKKPFWGNYLTDTSEHYYPYREALVWLKSNFGNAHIMFAGMYYTYRFEFYFNQLDWKPEYTLSMTKYLDDDSLSLSQALTEAENNNFDIVLFQVLGSELPQVKDMHDFSEEKIFKNDAQTLIVFERNP
jgi:hypothetical protein